jgi:hypothetical protein
MFGLLNLKYGAKFRYFERGSTQSLTALLPGLCPTAQVSLDHSSPIEPSRTGAAS